jgi:hypothetical protein
VVLALIFVGARFTDAWINTEWLYYRGAVRRARAARPPGDPDPVRADRDRHPRSVRVPVPPAAPADLVHQARRRHPRGLHCSTDSW